MAKILGILTLLCTVSTWAAPTICSIGQTEFLNISHPDYRKEIHLNSAIAIGKNRFVTSAYFIKEGLLPNLKIQDRLNKKIKDLGYKTTHIFIECKDTEGEKQRVNLSTEDVVYHPSFDKNKRNLGIIEIYKPLDIKTVSIISEVNAGESLKNCHNIKSKESVLSKSDEYTLCKKGYKEYLAAVNTPEDNLNTLNIIDSMNILYPFTSYFNKDSVDFTNYSKAEFYQYERDFLNRDRDKKEFLGIISEGEAEIQRGKNCIAKLNKLWIFKPRKRISSYNTYINSLNTQLKDLKDLSKVDLKKAKELRESFKDFNYSRCPDF